MVTLIELEVPVVAEFLSVSNWSKIGQNQLPEWSSLWWVWSIWHYNHFNRRCEYIFNHSTLGLLIQVLFFYVIKRPQTALSLYMCVCCAAFVCMMGIWARDTHFINGCQNVRTRWDSDPRPVAYQARSTNCSTFWAFQFVVYKLCHFMLFFRSKILYLHTWVFPTNSILFIWRTIIFGFIKVLHYQIQNFFAKIWA